MGDHRLQGVVEDPEEYDGVFAVRKRRPFGNNRLLPLDGSRASAILR
jgi:hypothetical protein